MGFFVPLYIIAALLVAFYGRDRALGFPGILLFSLFFTPIVMTLALALTIPVDRQGR